MEFEKTAQEQYKFLLTEFEKKQVHEEVEKLAMAVITKMVEKSDITEPGEVIEKLAELRQQSIEDLKVLEKAVELGRNTKETSVKLGSLSDEASYDGKDPLTSFLLEDY